VTWPFLRKDSPSQATTSPIRLDDANMSIVALSLQARHPICKTASW
jgi:hypothetical protein